MEGQHIHIGPGRAGLGLIAAASAEAGIGAHIVARRGSVVRSDTRFGLKVIGLGGRIVERDLPVRSVSRAGTFEELEPACKDAVLHAPSLLITTAVTTEELPGLKDFLLELTLQRTAARSTVFIAGENDVGARYSELTGPLAQAGVDCRRVVVNRVCPCVCDDVAGLRVVTVDELAEWIIAGEAGRHPVLEQLQRAQFVEFVPDVHPYELRKRWLVNGVHLALAIVAHGRPVPTIRAAVETGGLEWATALQRTLIESLEHKYPDLPGNLEYATAHLPVWLRHSDPVARIMKRLRREDPIAFLIDFERKFASAVREHPDRSARMTEEVVDVFDSLHVVLQRAESYVDFADLRRVLRSIPNTSDTDVMFRYRELLRDILAPDLLRRRVESLGVSYAKHRDIHATA